MPGAWRGAWRRAALLAPPRCCAGPGGCRPPRAAAGSRSAARARAARGHRVTGPLRAKGRRDRARALAARRRAALPRTAGVHAARDLSAYGADAVELGDEPPSTAIAPAPAPARFARGDHDSEHGAGGHGPQRAARAVVAARGDAHGSAGAGRRAVGHSPRRHRVRRARASPKRERARARAPDAPWGGGRGKRGAGRR